MTKLLLTSFTLASTLLLSGCVEETSAGGNNTLVECIHHDQKVTYNINSANYNYTRSDSVIKITNGQDRVYYPAHLCIITENR